MANNDYDTVIVGGGAAGVAAAHRLHAAGVNCILLEARERLGGRAFTEIHGGFPIDLGCGWFHSADRNPWVAIAERQGRTIDKTPPPWAQRPSLPYGFPIEQQREFIAAMNAFFARQAAAAKGPDEAAAALLEPGNRWNGLIGAINTYISGGDLDRLSVHDLENYDATDVNWRAVEGYGATVAAHSANVPTRLGCVVRTIDHGGARLKIETAKGALTCDRVIVAVSTAQIADETVKFTPALHDKTDAAARLPLGLADKLFLSLENAEEFPRDSRVFGHTDRTETGAYHLRPFGRPMIEVYLGGSNARHLENGGERAFFDFAISELAHVFGSGFAKRVKLLHIHLWGRDPFARGSYSYALPGHAGDRATLAATVDNRVFFAGEACSKHDYSTAHGAYRTGLAATEAVLAARKRS